MQAPSIPSLRESQPRCLPRRHVTSTRGTVDLLDEIVDFAAVIGYTPGEWQKMPLRDWSTLDEQGKFVHRRCGLSVPRQAGKSVDAIIWAAFLVLQLGYAVLWTDHNYSTTCEMLSRFQKILGKRKGDPDALPAINKRIASSKAKTAQESYEFTNGGVLCFSTRTESASLGYSFDVVIYDEAQLLTSAQAQTINPTTTHAPHRNAQFIYAGTPTRAGCPADRFSNMREEAWSDSPKGDLCWLEYGADKVGDPLDESRWPLVNPSLAEGLVDADDVRPGIYGMEGDDLGIAQEYLGYWLPKQERLNPPVIGEASWEACKVRCAPAPAKGDRIGYGLRFSADGSRMALAAAVQPRGSDVVHAELIFSESTAKGTTQTAYWLAARAGKACSVAIDGKSGAGAVCNALDELGMPKGYVIRPSADDAITAANYVVDGCVADSPTLTHVDDPALKLSAETSWRREIGKQGGWGFGGENACPIEAVGLAILALKTSKRKPGRKAKVSR